LCIFGATAAAAAPATLSVGSDGRCIATGAAWKLGSVTGTKYVVGTRGAVTCAFVQTWVARLSRAHLSQIGGTGTLTGGPSGWTCKANGLRYQGACYLTGTSDIKAFVWVAKR
jgi:hypothetical protein